MIAIHSVLLQPLSWSLVSDRTSPEVQYHVYCTVAYVVPDHIVWEKNNNTIKMNTTTTTISYQLVDTAIDNYTNILTVTGDHHTQNISCAAEYGSGTFIVDELIIIEGLNFSLNFIPNLCVNYILQLLVVLQWVWQYLSTPHPVSQSAGHLQWEELMDMSSSTSHQMKYPVHLHSWWREGTRLAHY